MATQRKYRIHLLFMLLTAAFPIRAHTLPLSCDEVFQNISNNVTFHQETNNRRKATSQQDPQTTAVLHLLRQRMENAFPTTGYSSLSEFRMALRSISPKVELLRRIIVREEFVVQMQVPPEHRMLVASEGFKNLYETGSNRGKNEVEKRLKAEARSLGKSNEEYARIPHSLRPKYATMAPRNLPSAADQITYPRYGSDLYIFKNDRIRQRTTFTAGDSYNRSLNRSEPNLQKWWDEFLLPWNYRELLVPDIAAAEKADCLFVSRYAGKLQNGLLSKSTDFLKRFKKGEEQPWGQTVEAQIFGRLNLDDISDFVFTDVVPSAEFLAMLKSYSIQVWDGRVQPHIVFDY